MLVYGSFRLLVNDTNWFCHSKLSAIIDNYSELNDTLNDSNSAILDAINKEISLQRQIRDNTKTEEEIANDEAQLAYLRRDTTGGNDLAAL